MEAFRHFLGFRVQGLGLRAWGSVFEVKDLGYGVWGLEFRVQGLKLRVSG